MKAGDLVRVKRHHLWGSSGEVYGLITEIEKEFYRNVIASPKDDRLTIFWNHGAISSEPESYVEKVE